MRLTHDLQQTLEQTRPESLGDLREEIPLRVIEEALSKASTTEKRRRVLPQETVIWLVIGMALMRDRCIQAVAAHMKLGEGARLISEPGIVQARNRVGSRPLEALFEYTALEWALRSALGDPWRGLSMFGVDGTTFRVADSVENEAEFGRPVAATGRGAAGYPQLRAVALMALRSRLLLGATIGPYRVGEVTMAGELWPLLPERSLVLLDKGFIDYALFHRLMACGQEKHFLCRARSNLKWTELRQLGPGDVLVQVALSSARRTDPSLPKSLVLRATTYQRRGFKPQVLLSSLLDPVAFPADEIRGLYHERWELEIGYDEIKTHTLDREEALRSKAPERVRQEVWGLLLAYNLVRRQIEKFAATQDVHPLRISYRNTLLLVRNLCACASTGVGSVRKLIDSMEQTMALFILPERRARRFPRQVKIKMSNFKKKPVRPPGGQA